MDEKTTLINLSVDENSRIITIPTVKNVFGIEGDIEVNRLTFSLPRYYSGFDMSEFSVRVNYVNANKEANYYEADDATSDKENITFSWLMGPDVTAYAGDVKFSIKLYKKQDAKVVKVFNTKFGSGTVYAGLDVEGTVTPEEQQTLLEQIEAEIKEDLNTYTEEKLSEIQNRKNEVIAMLDDYKTSTAGYAETAKTNANSATADRQAVTDMAAQVTADKSTVAENTAKVAEDRTAAETAAQTAQAVADSLPDDYTTAVEKIAENTAEIGRVKLTDKELQRRVNALYDMGNGITHKFETDTETAYAKTVPTGGKLMSVKSVGGRSIVFNQLIPDSIIHVTVTIDEDVTEEKWLKQIVADTSPIARAIGHKVVGKCIRDINNPSSYVTVRFGNNNVNISNGSERYTTTENGIYTLSSGVGNPPPLYFRAFAGATAGTYGFTLQLFDLTAMFGSGNEPTTVEEFEAMFPSDYYPYNAGEIVSAGTESVVVRGQNLWDEIWEEGSIDSATGVDISAPTVIRSKNYTSIIPNSTYIFAYVGSTAFENVKTRFYDIDKKYIGYNDNNAQTVLPNRAFVTPVNAAYVRFALPPAYGNVYKNDIALIAGSSGDYTPYHPRPPTPSPNLSAI